MQRSQNWIIAGLGAAIGAAAAWFAWSRRQQPDRIFERTVGSPTMGLDSDDAVLARAHTTLRSLACQPELLSLSVHDGALELTGVMLEAELDTLLNALKRTVGVRKVTHHVSLARHRRELSAIHARMPLPH